MKKLFLLSIAAVALLACNSNPEVTETESPIAGLEAWLDSIDNLGDVTAEQMTAIEAEFAAATEGIDMEGMSEEDKRSMELIKGRWETFKLNNAIEEEMEEEEQSTEGDSMSTTEEVEPTEETTDSVE